MRHETYYDAPIVALSSGLSPVFHLLHIIMRSTLFALAKVVNVSTAELQDITRTSTGIFL
jgi:hypothetical protein